MAVSCQLPRIIAGLKELDCIEATDTEPNCDFVYANDEPRWQEAIDYRAKHAPQAKLILCVLDVPEWLMGSGFHPSAFAERLKKADLVVTISEFVAQQLRRYYGINTAPIIYQPIQPITPEIRLSGARPYPHRALVCGRNRDPNKRAVMGVSALMRAGFQGWEVAVVGEAIGYGDYLGQQLNPSILNGLFNSVDFVVCCTLGAGLELPVFEAFAGGAVPIFCSDLTTAHDSIVNGLADWSSYPSVPALTHRLRQLIDDAALMATTKKASLEASKPVRYGLHPCMVAYRLLSSYYDLILKTDADMQHAAKTLLRLPPKRLNEMYDEIYPPMRIGAPQTMTS